MGYRGVGLRWQRLEPVLWCVLAVGSVSAQLEGRGLHPRLSRDSFQYLSAAEQLRSTRRIATPLIHFETEQRHGAVPAPLTWFPPGYPAAIAAVSMAGTGYETAALLISAACFVFVAAGLWHLVRMLDPSPWAARAALFCWITSCYALTFSISALSESMFTALGLAMLLLVLRTDGSRAGARNTLLWGAAAVVAGASYWVRYAGLFWAAACMMLCLAQLVLPGRAKRACVRSGVAVAVLLVVCIAPLMVRNHLLAGDFRGGNNIPAPLHAGQVLAQAQRALFHLALGDASASQLRIPLLLLAAGIAGFGATIAAARAGKRGGVRRELLSCASLKSYTGIVLAALVIYAAGLGATSALSIVDYGPRMLVPAIPLLIAVLVCGFAVFARLVPAGAGARQAGAVFLMCALAGYAAANAVSHRSLGPDAYDMAAAALAAPDETGASLGLRLSRELSAGEVIAATNGQAAGYVLKHPAISLLERPYRRTPWRESEVRAYLERFGVRRLLIFRNPDADPAVRESPFLRELAAGRAPSWLRPAGFNRSVYLYHVETGRNTE